MMTLYIILTLTSFLTVFGLIIVWTWRDGQLPTTVSDMAYGHTERRQRWCYTLWLWASTFTLTPALFQLMHGQWLGLAHAYATSVVLCGLLPLLLRERNMSFALFGLSAGVFSQCCVCVLCPWWLLTWTHLGALVAFTDHGHLMPRWIIGRGVFIVEFFCWFNIAAAILTKLLTTR